MKERSGTREKKKKKRVNSLIIVSSLVLENVYNADGGCHLKNNNNRNWDFGICFASYCHFHCSNALNMNFSNYKIVISEFDSENGIFFWLLF